MNVERRGSQRQPVELACQVHLLLPTDTFHPVPYLGRLVDVSMGGARFEIKGLPKDMYQRLLGGNGYVKALIPLGQSVAGEKTEERMIGKIVWMDYHSHPPCLALGIAFDAADTEVVGVVRKILWLAGVPKSTSE